jgi:ATP-binding cassette subfamily A (ABC1) protein 3
MEEAEALATNVAIMGTKMLAIGSLSLLQKEYGGKFSVRAVRAAGMDALRAKSLIEIEFANEIIGYTDIQGQINFRLSSTTTTFGKMMERMEKLKEQTMTKNPKVIEDYTISGPTLEEVFMNVARVAGQYSGV